jgi:hypothetical protein
MLELLMSEWEELLENPRYKPVHVALQAGIKLLEKYYRRSDDTLLLMVWLPAVMLFYANVF